MITGLPNRIIKFIIRWSVRPKVRLVLGLAVGLGLGLLLTRGMEWTKVAREFQGIPFQYALASLAFFLAITVLRAYRWQVLFIRQKVPLTRLLLVQNAGIGLNNLIPFRVISEATQFSMLKLRYGMGGGEALATLAMERLLDLVITALLLMAGLTLISSKAVFLPYVVGAFVVAVAAVLLVPALVWASRSSFLRRVPLLVSVAVSMVALAKHKRALPLAFLWTLVYWLGVGLTGWILAYGMGLGISPFVATLAILGTLYFATSLPGLPLAAGTFEFAIVYVLKFFDVVQEQAFSYGVVIHAVLFLPPTIVAFVVFPGLIMRFVKRPIASAAQEDGKVLVADAQESRS